jgi:itaconate CoA-transferase
LTLSEEDLMADLAKEQSASTVERPPLAGVRVLSLEQAVAAPLCTQHLLDLGADVVKIERPEIGDFARAYDSAVDGESAWFYWINRGKRSLALDIKHASAGEILGRLLSQADVFIQNLGPGAANRIGLAPKTLRVRYPRLVICSISGYGPDGPYRDRKAYDALLQGETGVIALSGSPDEPVKTGVSVADIATGMYSLSSILAALYRRANDGEGAIIETSLLDSLSQWVAPYVYGYLATGRQPNRYGARHANIVPYGLYATGGGKVNVAVQNEREWVRFCEAVLREPELVTDSRYSSNERRVRERATLEPHIEATLSALSHEEVVERLESADLPWGDYRDVAGLACHPQLVARGRLLSPDVDGNPPVIAHPMNIEGVRHRAGRTPSVGGDTDAVLTEAGYSPAEIAALHSSGAVG